MTIQPECYLRTETISASKFTTQSRPFQQLLVPVRPKIIRVREVKGKLHQFHHAQYANSVSVGVKKQRNGLDRRNQEQKQPL